MTISNSDLKVLEAERMTDSDDAGGRATGREVVDGAMNNIFADISRVDRVTGRSEQLKVFVGPVTNTADKALGLHVILDEPPSDQNTHVILFRTNSDSDERREARDRMEAYVAQAGKAAFWLFGNQLKGQRSINVFQETDLPIPEIGETYLLTNTETQVQQYVRLTDITHAERTFKIPLGTNLLDRVYNVMALSLSAPLEHDFPGGQPSLTGTELVNNAGIDVSDAYATQVADAATYYSTTTLVQDAAAGEPTINVANVTLPLVPSATSEKALVNQAMLAEATTVLAASNSTLTRTLSVGAAGSVYRCFVGGPILPGTASVKENGRSWIDFGNGNLVYAGAKGATQAITVDYASGLLEFVGNPGSTISVTWRPGALYGGRQLGYSMDITTQNRGYAYTVDLSSCPPQPGSLEIYYLSMGSWQRLSDAGAGELTGDGAGTVDYASGAVSLSLQYLPDPDTKLVWLFVTAEAVETNVVTGAINLPFSEIELNLNSTAGIGPGSVVITWKEGGADRSASDDGKGRITGNATGSIDYASGRLGLSVAAIADDGYTVAYDNLTLTAEEVVIDKTSGAPLIQLPPNLYPGTVQLSLWRTEHPLVDSTGERLYYLKDNGDGEMLWYYNGVTTGARGVVDYATGVINLSGNFGNYNIKGAWFNGTVTVYYSTFTPSVAPGHALVATYALADDDTSAASPAKLENGDLQFPLLDFPGQSYILPNSLRFIWGANEYFERAGVIYKGFDSTTNAAEAVGTIDRSTSLVTLSSYPASGLGLTANIVSMATATDSLGVLAATLRIPGRPLRAGSLQVNAQTMAGAVITGVSDENGVVSGDISGNVNQEAAVATLSFSEPVVAASVRFNAVIQTTLPLDAGIIGIDPVRLPPDGRVPIFRPASVAVMRHKGSDSLGSPEAAQVVNLSRGNLAECQVVDQDGKALKLDQYSVDLDAGTLTFANPLSIIDADGNALTEPLLAEHWIEHMSMVSEVSPSGDLVLQNAPAQAFPAGETRVASAVLYGTKQALVHDVFSDTSWSQSNPNWTNDPLAPPSAQYNDVDNPILVTNAGAVAEKWALVFNSSTAFSIISQGLGVVGNGTTTADCAPQNERTNQPYFVLKSAGWGSGWSAGNVLRFDTEAAIGELWMSRTVLPGPSEAKDDQYRLQVRADAD